MGRGIRRRLRILIIEIVINNVIGSSIIGGTWFIKDLNQYYFLFIQLGTLCIIFLINLLLFSSIDKLFFNKE